MTKKKAPIHPFDTNDFEDLPAGTSIKVSIRFKDRIHGVCRDVHNCTIANAITSQDVGIVALGRRGVSRTFVGMYLDKRTFPWAVEGQVYRGRLTPASAELAVELDGLTQSPRMQAATKRTLQRLADASKAAGGLGDEAEFAVVEIVAPYPSEQKGYRKNARVRGQTGKGTKTPNNIPRRTYASDIKRVPAVKRPRKRTEAA